jgi:hypothetical protein
MGVKMLIEFGVAIWTKSCGLKLYKKNNNESKKKEQKKENNAQKHNA